MSTSHAYDGLVRTNAEWFPSAGFAPQGDIVYADGSGNWTNGLSTTLQRHDIVAYYGSFGAPNSTNIRHSQIMLDSAHTWAANNDSQGAFTIRNLEDYSISISNKVSYIQIWRK